MKIYFTDTAGISTEYQPCPAIRSIPEWYKKTEEYSSGKRIITNGSTPHTIKKCVPVFDAMTAGYIIKTYVDVQVVQKDNAPWYEWPMLDAISFHPIDQAFEHPAQNGFPYPKWRNPWAISTPRGYSVLFISPMHSPNNIFTILPGIVDTDKYTAPVNFPFVLNDPKWEGLIPAGTSIAQVIPFKRDNWQMNFGNLKDLDNQNMVTTRLKSLWFNSYKRQFWTRKQYQ